MSPSVGVDPTPPGPGAEEAAIVVAWRELRGQAVGLAAAAEERADLARRLEAALEVRRGLLRQGAALDEMRRRVELQRVRAEEAVVGRRRALEGVERRKELLQEQIERVLQLSRALAAAHQRVQEAKEVLSGDRARLGDLQRLLRTRQQCMVGQVAALYPVRVFHDLQQHAENRHADTNWESGTLSEENRTISGANGTHLPSVIKSPQICALTFFGWQIMKHKRKQKSYSDKELQRSAAVLGYAAHAVLLIASYLDVPLRYPLRFGGSRSYVSDCLPSAETASVASADHPSINNTYSKLTEYPLFLECQEYDSTNASYAIYLLHKDTEQLLNYIGAESSGSHLFGNLRELFRIILSDEYLYW
ncbi:vacuolar protein sorting 38-like [Phragmites australis]|uniref:vacuolar protein sorting 38-like n=1 Tax=Phragmites australis TaxID=29695 RepID=UPI002D766B8F|nr:vacuolar protein sorting 38-like [Phragmites australis]